MATQVPDVCFYITGTHRASAVSPFFLIRSVLICTLHEPVIGLGTGWQVRSLPKFGAGEVSGSGDGGLEGEDRGFTANK